MSGRESERVDLRPVLAIMERHQAAAARALDRLDTAVGTQINSVLPDGTFQCLLDTPSTEEADRFMAAAADLMRLVDGVLNLALGACNPLDSADTSTRQAEARAPETAQTSPAVPIADLADQLRAIETRHGPALRRRVEVMPMRRGYHLSSVGEGRRRVPLADVLDGDEALRLRASGPDIAALLATIEALYARVLGQSPPDADPPAPA